MYSSLRRQRFVACAAVGMCFVLTGCGGSTGHGRDTGRPSSVAAGQSASSSPSEVPASPPAAESPVAAPTLLGTAATNPACKLLSVDQVATISGLPVTGIRGLPSDPAQHSESCTWYLEPKNVQSSLVVQYKLYPQAPTQIVTYYKQVIEQGYGKAVPKLGSISKIYGHVIDTVYKRAEIHVTLLTHAEATAADQTAAIQITRLVMAGIKQ